MIMRLLEIHKLGVIFFVAKSQVVLVSFGVLEERVKAARWTKCRGLANHMNTTCSDGGFRPVSLEQELETDSNS